MKTCNFSLVDEHSECSFPLYNIKQFVLHEYTKTSNDLYMFAFKNGKDILLVNPELLMPIDLTKDTVLTVLIEDEVNEDIPMGLNSAYRKG